MTEIRLIRIQPYSATLLINFLYPENSLLLNLEEIADNGDIDLKK
jgi:hypothetical protein